VRNGGYFQNFGGKISTKDKMDRKEMRSKVWPITRFINSGVEAISMELVRPLITLLVNQSGN
jgi:hypothetical protein